MDNLLRPVFTQTANFAYQTLRPFIFRRSAQQAHTDIVELLRQMDDSSLSQAAAKLAYHLSLTPEPIYIGGVHLQHPFILAAGFVKGDGFDSEEAALQAVSSGKNIIPGWQTMPALVGLVEFGSFTRWPRLGNSGTVMWRDATTHSTQNRVGLKNPGAVAAAAFLSRHKDKLPQIFGINIAVSPGVDNLNQEQQEIVEAIQTFTSRGIQPSWFTLNISCPNTEDDPHNNQTENKTRALCQSAVHAAGSIPLWVKISPELAQAQYQVLMQVFEETGVKAVIATNTLPRTAPDHTIAGVGGGKLHPHSLDAAALLMREKHTHHYAVDIIGCGGIQDPLTYAHYKQLDIHAVQYWSGLIYRGPFIAAMLQQDT